VHRAPDGNLFYHGRADTQVKIRGYRIELEEIEMRLAEREGVRQAACAVQDGALAAFVVPENGWTERGFDALEASLREALPDYMVPSRFGILRELPLTPGGKLDRAALPRLGGPARAKAGMAPRNALGKRCWRKCSARCWSSMRRPRWTPISLPGWEGTRYGRRNW
jgi:acyl-coenzyme A synthetase/AMP-(fatty) acid ligase